MINELNAEQIINMVGDILSSNSVMKISTDVQDFKQNNLFKDFTKSEKYIIIEFLVKQHDKCKNSIRQEIYYEDLLDLGIDVERIKIGEHVLGDIYKITKVSWEN